MTKAELIQNITERPRYKGVVVAPVMWQAITYIEVMLEY